MLELSCAGSQHEMMIMYRDSMDINIPKSHWIIASPHVQHAVIKNIGVIIPRNPSNFILLLCLAIAVWKGGPVVRMHWLEAHET